MSMNSDYFYQQISNQRLHELTARAAEERLAKELPRQPRRPWWQRLMGLNWRSGARAKTARAKAAQAEVVRAEAARAEAVKAAQRRNHPSVRMHERHMAP